MAIHIEDSRFEAWHRIASHPFFRDTYGSGGPLIDAMITKLDNLMPKPWLDAKPGEVWLFRGWGDAELPFTMSHDGWRNTAGVLLKYPLPYGSSRDETHTPRRIWPETKEQA